MRLSGDEYIKSSNYFLNNGLTSLASTMSKKFAKNLDDLVISYYREKKDIVKKKEKKLLGGQI